MVYRNDIDGLRAVAVILVILSHVHLLPGGYIGVDIFFVISGFLIAPRILADLRAGTFSATNFYTRRAKRLLPQVYLLIMVCFAFTYLFFLPSDIIAFSKSAIATVFYSSNFYFLSQTGYFAPDAITQPLLHTWSLAVEEQFYFVIPIIIYILAKLRIPILGLFIIGVVSLTISAVTTPIWTGANFYMLPFRAWEFIVGALIAFAPYAPRKIRDAAALSGVTIIVWSVVALDEASMFPGINALPVVIGTALIIWSGPANFLANILATYPMRITGRASYSLYIWHWPIIVFYSYYSFGEFSLKMQITMIVATFFAGFFFWFIWEEPIRKSAFTPKITFSYTAICAIIFSIIAVVVISKNGLPFRLNDAAREMALSGTEKSRYPVECIKPIGDNTEDTDIKNLCRLGAENTKPIFALWGDSHAAALAYGISEQAKKLGISGVLISVNSCPPVIGIDGWWSVTSDQCRQTNGKIVEILNNLRISNVFLHATWSALNNSDYVKSWAKRFIDGNQPFMDATAIALVNTIKTLHENDITPIIIQDTPGAPGTITQMLTQKLQTGSTKELKVLRETYDNGQKLTAQIFENIKGLEILKPSDLLCDAIYCEVSIGNKSLHYDGAHLSETGSLAVSAIAVSVLTRIKSLQNPNIQR